jgi:hypothetical protein
MNRKLTRLACHFTLALGVLGTAATANAIEGPGSGPPHDFAVGAGIAESPISGSPTLQFSFNAIETGPAGAAMGRVRVEQRPPDECGIGFPGCADSGYVVEAEVRCLFAVAPPPLDYLGAASISAEVTSSTLPGVRSIHLFVRDGEFSPATGDQFGVLLDDDPVDACVLMGVPGGLAPRVTHGEVRVHDAVEA